MKKAEDHRQNTGESQSSWQFYLVVSAVAAGILIVILKGIGLF